jgi:hypothetical protein
MQHASRIVSAGLMVGLMLGGAGPIAADNFPADGHLPFDMPARSVLASKPKKVFAHYFTPFVQKINNNPPATDYYTQNFLDPYGENHKHEDYGGLLRQRPLPRAPLHLSEIDNMGLSDMRYEVRLARAAGFDGFAVDILSYEGQNWERVLKMFDAAAAEADDFKLIIMPDMSGVLKNNAAKVIQVIQTLAAHPAAFKHNGKVVVAPYLAEHQTPTWWQDEVLDELGFDVVFWPVFQGWSNDLAQYPGFVSMSYGVSDWGSHNPTGANNILGAAATAQGMGLKWMGPVNPQSMRPRHLLYSETRGSETFLNFWNSAIAGGADWVQIVTWNDQGEGTTIVPSTRTTHAFYDLAAYYTAWFKMDAAPTITRDTIYAFYRSQSTDAAFDVGNPQTEAFTHFPSHILPENEIELLAFLTAPAKLQITIGGQTYTSPTMDAGVRHFRVPLAEGTPIFRIRRGGGVVHDMEGWFVIENDGLQVQNLLYNAMSSRRINPAVNELALSHWWRRGNYNSNIKLTQSYDRSPYERLTNDLAARYTDTSSGGGGGTGFGYSFLSPGDDYRLTVTFDFRIINVGDNTLNPTVSLIDDNADAGPFLELFHDNGSGYCLANKVTSTGATPISGTNLSLGTWYRVQMIVDSIEGQNDTYTIKLTRPNDSTSTHADLPFRYQLDDITGVRFVHNGNAAAKGGFLIDNVHVARTPLP